MSLGSKYDFKVIFSVKNANPNGDPLNGNRPRQDFEGFGEVSDVAIKRKIRNRLQDFEERVFIQSSERSDDGFNNLKDRLESVEELKNILKDKKKADVDAFARAACASWIDVRSFGQVFAFSGTQVSVGVRGPVSVQLAESIEPVEVNSMQITKSVNSVAGDGKGSDTMGTKHFVTNGLYTFNGSINPQLAEKTGFSDEDAEKILEALKSLFENDASAARPEGSMVVEKVYWWKHPSKSGKHPSAKVHRSVKIAKKEGIDTPHAIEDYIIAVEELDGLPVQEFDGM